MFDHAAFTDGNIDQATVDQTNRIVDHVRSLLVDEIAARGDTLGYTVAAYANSYAQSHIRRALEFIDGGMEAWEGDHLLVTATCARSMLESVACFQDFCRRLTALLDEGDPIKALTFITGQAFATKLTHLHDKDRSNVATNIMTQLDKLEKAAPGLRAIYDQLSELVHPNGLGVAAHFARLDTETGITHFRFPEERRQGNLVRLLGAAYFLGKMIQDINALTARIEEFIRTEAE
jgi:hypothetical protein